MKRVLVRTGGAALVLALGCWSSVGAQELPFEPTAKGLQDYANNADWGAKKLKFSNIGEGSNWDGWGSPCRDLTDRGGDLLCGGGYVEIRSPLGVQTCELDPYKGLYISNGRLGFETNECNELKPVAAEPPKEKPPEPPASQLAVKPDQITPANRPGTITLNRNEAIFGGGLIALISVLAGVAIGKRSEGD